VLPRKFLKLQSSVYSIPTTLPTSLLLCSDRQPLRVETKQALSRFATEGLRVRGTFQATYFQAFAGGHDYLSWRGTLGHALSGSKCFWVSRYWESGFTLLRS
jgi:hypothetical protein